jgi:hypothetical protein
MIINVDILDAGLTITLESDVGPRGLKGDKGDKGDTGERGPIGFTALTVWTTLTRPEAPVVGDSFGFNTDFDGLEVYTSQGWLVTNGIWLYTTRPATAGLAPGSKGYNMQIEQFEFWDGREWRLA